MTAVGLLAACQGHTLYHSYRSIPTGGWTGSDTLVYALPASVPAGHHHVEIDIRYSESYPYRNIWLAVSYNLQDSLVLSTDTLQLMLADEEGNRPDNTPGGWYSHSSPYKQALPVRAGNNRIIRVHHLMKDSLLSGINDVGIHITR